MVQQTVQEQRAEIERREREQEAQRIEAAAFREARRISRQARADPPAFESGPEFHSPSDRSATSIHVDLGDDDDEMAATNGPVVAKLDHHQVTYLVGILGETKQIGTRSWCLKRREFEGAAAIAQCTDPEQNRALAYCFPRQAAAVVRRYGATASTANFLAELDLAFPADKTYFNQQLGDFWQPRNMNLLEAIEHIDLLRESAGLSWPETLTHCRRALIDIMVKDRLHPVTGAWRTVSNLDQLLGKVESEQIDRTSNSLLGTKRPEAPAAIRALDVVSEEMYSTRVKSDFGRDNARANGYPHINDSQRRPIERARRSESPSGSRKEKSPNRGGERRSTEDAMDSRGGSRSSRTGPKGPCWVCGGAHWMRECPERRKRIAAVRLVSPRDRSDRSWDDSSSSESEGPTLSLPPLPPLKIAAMRTATADKGVASSLCPDFDEYVSDEEPVSSTRLSSLRVVSPPTDNQDATPRVSHRQAEVGVSLLVRYHGRLGLARVLVDTGANGANLAMASSFAQKLEIPRNGTMEVEQVSGTTACYDVGETVTIFSAEDPSTTWRAAPLIGRIPKSFDLILPVAGIDALQLTLRPTGNGTLKIVQQRKEISAARICYWAGTQESQDEEIATLPDFVDELTTDEHQRALQLQAEVLEADPRCSSQARAELSAVLGLSSTAPFQQFSLPPYEPILISSKRICCPPRNVPEALLPAYQAQVADYVRRGHWVPNESPAQFQLAVRVVPKKDRDGKIDPSKLRLCVDASPLNAITTSGIWPMPSADSIIQQLAGHRVLSTLDIALAYHQVKLTVEFSRAVRIATPFGLFQPKRLFFGLAGAPAHFQHAMDTILSGTSVRAYIDDLALGAESKTAAVQLFLRVAKRLLSVGLRLQPLKVELFKSEVRLLGRLVSGDAVGPECQKLADLFDRPQPSSITELRSFLGLLNFVASHVGDVRQERKILAKALQHKQWAWTSEMAASYASIQEAIRRAKPLHLTRDSAGNFVVVVDFSGDGLGAWLCQSHFDFSQFSVELPVAAFKVFCRDVRLIRWAQRVLTGAEVNYFAPEGEASALRFAISKFSYFLLGRVFTVLTDQRSLALVVRNQISKSARLERLLALVSEYQFKVLHVAGELNPADYLSRRFQVEAEEKNQCNEVLDVTPILPTTMRLPDHSDMCKRDVSHTVAALRGGKLQLRGMLSSTSASGGVKDLTTTRRWSMKMSRSSEMMDHMQLRMSFGAWSWIAMVCSSTRRAALSSSVSIKSTQELQLEEVKVSTGDTPLRGYLSQGDKIASCLVGCLNFL